MFMGSSYYCRLGEKKCKYFMVEGIRGWCKKTKSYWNNDGRAYLKDTCTDNYKKIPKSGDIVSPQWCPKRETKWYRKIRC